MAVIQQWLLAGSIAVVCIIIYLNLFVFNDQFLMSEPDIHFTVSSEHLGEIGGMKFIIRNNGGHPISFANFLDLMVVEDQRFRSVLIGILLDFPSEAYFWECKSVTLSTLESTAFEFVVIPSSELAGVNGSASAFQDKFSSCGVSKIVTFPNIGRLFAAKL